MLYALLPNGSLFRTPGGDEVFRKVDGLTYTSVEMLVAYRVDLSPLGEVVPLSC